MLSECFSRILCFYGKWERGSAGLSTPGQQEGVWGHFEPVQSRTDGCGRKKFVLLQESQALTGPLVIGTALGWVEKLKNWELGCSCLFQCC